MVYEQLTIDPRGEWSPAQAQRVLAIINPQAAAHGLVFNVLDITTMQHAARRLLLVAYCIEHGVAVALDDVCRECVKHAKT